MSIQISANVFNSAIPTPLTNEVPHLSVYDLLNKQFKMDWSRQLIGNSIVHYENKESVKKIAGAQSDNYVPKIDEVVNPENNKKYLITRDKVNFDIDGFVETEMDYLMHETIRYLGKLYPDDMNSLITLTEMERQSYFNEALHMIHSYFDTAQILDEDEANTFYFRLKFLLGITGIRKITGVLDQEKELIQLLNVDGFKFYTGYDIAVDEDSNVQFSTQKRIEQNQEFNLFKYVFCDEKSISKKLLKDLRAYTDDFNFLTFFENISEKNSLSIKSSFLPLYKINLYGLRNIIEEYVLDPDPEAKRESINRWISDGVSAGSLFMDTNLENLIEIQPEHIFPNFQHTPVYFIESLGASNFVVPAVGDKFKISDLLKYQDSYFVNHTTLGDLPVTYLLKTGNIEFNKHFSLCMGNLIVWNLQQCNQKYEIFKDQMNSAAFNSTVFMTFSIRRPLKEGEREKQIEYLEDLKKKINEGIKSLEEKGEYTFTNPWTAETTGHTMWVRYLNQKQDNFLDYTPLNLTDTIIDARNYFDAGKYRLAKKAIDYIFNNIKGKDFKVECFYCTVNKDFLKTLNLDNLEEQPNIKADFSENFTLDNVASSIKSLDLFEDFSWKNSDELEFCFFVDPMDFQNHPFENFYNYGENIEKYRLSKREEFKNYLSPDLNRYVYGDSLEVNYLNLPIDFIKNLYSIINDNVKIYFKEIENNKIVSYYNQYKIKENYNEDEIYSEPIESDLLSSLFYKKIKLTTNATCVTLPCYFESIDTLRVDKLPKELAESECKIQSIVIDNYGEVYNNEIHKIYKEGNYYYFKGTELNLQNKDLRNGLLIIERHILNPLENIYEKSYFTNDRIFEKRKIADSKIYKNDQNFIYYWNWETLKESHINYTLNNLNCELPVTFADDSAISQQTKIPKSLSILKDLIILDLPTEKRDERYNLIKSLIMENKSLYLDSEFKLLNAAALNLNNLIYTQTYGDLGILLKDEIPSYISFYYKDPTSFNYYSKFQDMLDFIENGKKNELSIEDLEKIYTRRKIIWGNVVWDANDESRTVRVLRTIWAGYFSNFEIFSSNDIIPSEQVLISLPGENKGNNLQILNYNYSYNRGLPSLDWEFAVSSNPLGNNNIIIEGSDAFTHKTMSNAEKKLIFKENQMFYPLKFFISQNIPDVKNQLFKLITPFYVEKIYNDKNIYLEISNPIEVKLNPRTEKYEFTLDGKDIELDLVGNQLYTEENFKEIGIFDKRLGWVEKLLEFYISYFIKDEYLDKFINYTKENNKWVESEEKRTLDLKDFTNFAEDLTNYVKIRTDIEKDISGEFVFKTEAVNRGYVADKNKWDVNPENEEGSNKWEGLVPNIWEDLDYFDELFDQNFGLKLSRVLEYILQINKILAAVKVREDGLADIYYLVIEEKDDAFYLKGGCITEAFTANLVKSLTTYTSIPLLNSEKEYFVQSSNLNQHFLNTGKFDANFLNIDINLINYPEHDKNLNKYKLLENGNTPVFDYKKGYNEGEEGNIIDLTETKKNEDGEVVSITHTGEKDYFHHIWENGYIHPDGNETRDYLNGLYSNSATLNGNELTIKDYTYEVSNEYKYFKEYHDALVTLSLVKDQDSRVQNEIETHRISIDTDFDFLRKGYLYFYDLKVTNQRSSYSPEREILLIDRKLTIEDLRVDSYEVGKITLKDKFGGTQKVKSTADELWPIYSEEKKQLIKDDAIRLGKMWAEPSTNINYTFYKRKYIFEGMITIDDLQIIRPVDTTITEEGKGLQDHVSVGDKVQLFLLDPPSVYASPNNALTITGDSSILGHGPFKKIYEDTITQPGSTNKEQANTINRAVFSGKGILFTVIINLKDSLMGISNIKDNHSNEDVFFFEDNGVIYAKNNETKENWQYARTIPYLKDGSLDENKNIPAPIATQINLNSENALEFEYDSSKWGGTDDLINEGLNSSHADEKYEDTSKSIVIDKITLNTGDLYFTKDDKIFFQPTDDLPEFKDHPAKADYADFSGEYDTIVVEENGASVSKLINGCSEKELKEWIIKTLQDYYYTFHNSDDQTVEAYYKFPEMKLVTEDGESKAEISIDVQGSRRLAEILLHANDNTESYYFTQKTIYMPKIEIEDTPVYTDEDSQPKWKKSFILSESETKFEDASFDDLKKFARALLGTRYITRKEQNVSAWGKSTKNIVAWDQNSATITVMDATGKVVEKIATPNLGYEAALSVVQKTKNQNITALKNTFTIPNTIFIKDEKNVFDTTETTYEIDGTSVKGYAGSYVNGEYNLYKLFVEGPLNFANIYNKLNKSAIEDLDANPIQVGNTNITFSQILKGEAIVDDVKIDFEKYLEYMFFVDYMNASACRYITLKNPSSWLSYKNVQALTDGIDDAEIKDALRELGEGMESGGKEIPKGVPFITFEQYLNGYCNVAKLNENPLVSFSTNNDIFAYTSLVKESSIEVSETGVRVFGTITWPYLGDEDSSSSFLGKFKEAYKKEYAEAEDADQLVSDSIGELKAQLQRKFNMFKAGDYVAGDAPFMLNLNFDDFSFEPVTNVSEDSLTEDDIPLAVVRDGENFYAYTPKGKFDAGTSDQKAFQQEIDDSEPELNKADIQILDLVKQMKSATKTITISGGSPYGSSPTSYGNIKMFLQGTIAKNPVIMYSRVLEVATDYLKLEDFGLAMDDNQTNAIILIENKTKDNFQFGYGNITGFENISSIQSVFPVVNSDYADFATYDNSSSRTDESVFDLYPAWEKISAERRKYFYKMDEQNIHYLQNSFGKPILRITNASAMNYAFDIYKTGNTVAGENVNLNPAEDYETIASTIVGSSELKGKTWDKINKEYPNMQKVPELVNYPLDAIRKYAYNVAEFKLDDSSANDLNLFEGYDNLNQKTRYIELNVNLKDWDALEEFMSEDAERVSLIDLDVWIDNVTENYPLYKKITNYNVNVNGENTVIDTDYINEMIIPEKGYGQALIGSYKLPDENLFEDGYFFKEGKSTDGVITQNNKNEGFKLKKLVYDDQGRVKEIVDLNQTCRAMVYRSFKEADTNLDNELSTVNGIEGVQNFFLKLNDYNVEYNNISFTTKDVYPEICGDIKTHESQLLDMFVSNLKFGCKIIWSESIVDSTSLKIANLQKIGEEWFDRDEIIDKLGYTRIYAENRIPNNSPWLDKNDKLRFTNSNYAKDFNSLLCNEDGNLVGYDKNGNLSTTPGENGFFFGIKSVFTNSKSLLSNWGVTEDGIYSNIFNINEFMIITKDCFKIDYNKNLLKLSTDSKFFNFLFFENPSEKFTKFNRIKNVTITQKYNEDKELETTEKWDKYEEFKVKFNDLSFSLNYNTPFEAYNFAYLKNKKGETIAKVYYENPVTDKDLLIFSKIISK